MKSQVTRTKNRTNNLIWIILGVVIATAPLIHIYLPKSNPEVVAYGKTLDEKVDLLDSEILSLRESYDKGQISAEEYIAANDKITSERESLVEINDGLYDKKVDESRIFGFKTLRIFLVAFGIRVVYLFFSFSISLLIILLVRPEKGRLKSSLFILQVFCYSISFYQITWVFWNAQDYPIQTYWIAMFVCSAILATALVSFLMWYRFKLARQYQVIRRQFDFMHFDVKDKGYVNPMKENQYDRDTEVLVKEAIENE